MRAVFFIVLFITFSFSAQEQVEKKNIWLKTYSNYKNFNIIINNISKIEKRIESQKNTKNIDELNQKLNIYRSKLNLYDKNNSFDTILRKYKYEIPTITLYDFLFKDSAKKIDKLLDKYLNLKNQYYIAVSIIHEMHDAQKDDIDYFEAYSENIEKTYRNLLDLKDEIDRKYSEYQNEVFTKHLLTIAIIVISYLIYKVLLVLIFHFTQNKDNYEEQQNYKKLLSLLFVIFVLIFLVVRYIEDLIYIVTFLGVIAAALTIALREIILNIAGAIYIFFSNMVRVGDRVMVQFETKHTIGDIIDISLIKIKLSEIEDYSNIKELKSAGRTIYIPNSYIFTKVFYNYSLKKNGLINDLIEFEFDTKNDFKLIEDTTDNFFKRYNLPHNISFNLNGTKSAIAAIISYKVNFKQVSKIKGELTIGLIKEYQDNKVILKSSKKPQKSTDEDE